MKISIGSAAAATVLLTAFLALSCTRETPFSAAGGEVRFSVRSAVAGGSTKTAYSGERFTAADTERIDWEDGDLIRIASAEVSAPSVRWADYSVAGVAADGRYSRGSVEPAGSSLRWGTGTHTFYGVYPSPAASGAQAGCAFALSGSGAVASLVMPEVQAPGPGRPCLGQTYYGDMSLAYMSAYATASPGGPVSLLFSPEMTAFYVSVSNTTGALMHVTGVALTSSASALTGEYDVTVAPDGTRGRAYRQGSSWTDAPARTADNCAVRMPFGGGGVELGVDETLVVCLFALPVDITALTLEVSSLETGTLALELRYNGEWITFAGGKKHNLNNLGVPPVSWTLEVDRTLLAYDRSGAAGAAQRFTVTSVKTVGGVGHAAGWKTQVLGPSGWTDLSDGGPAWLAGFPVASSGGTALAESFEEDVEEQPVVSHEARLRAGKVYDSSGAVYDNSTKAAAVDLSRYNFINHRQEPMRTSANTYVVAAPGWYKIPMVYGNLYEDDNVVGKACKGARWALGHLDYFKKSSDANIYLGVNYPWLQSSFLDHARIHWEKYTHWDGSAAVTTGRQWSSGSDIGVIDGIDLNKSEEYLYFHVDATLIRPGNALLAVYDADGDCTWSWMVWITDQGMATVPVGGNDLLPVNLGWVDDTEGQYYAERSAVVRFASTEKEGLVSEEMTVLQPELERVSTSGWQTYYQWGRKDPLSGGVTNYYYDDGTLNKAIKHPSNIMSDTSTMGSDKYYDWTSANYNNLWDSQNTAWSSPTSGPLDHKTVYDPSPRGFSVPPDAAFDGFPSWGFERKEDGVFFYTSVARDATLFFPASGYMDFADAEVKDVDVSGYYWTARPGQNVQRRASYCLRFDQSGAGAPVVDARQYDATAAFPTAAYRAYGYSVRPVRYNVSAADSDVIVGAETREIVIADAAPGWGWTGDVNLKAGVSVSDGPVTLTVSGQNTLSANDPKYVAAEGALVLSNKNTLEVSVPAGRQVIAVSLTFTSEDGSALGRADLSAVSSPESGGGFTDGNGRKGHSASWNIESYSGGVFTPAASSVAFQTATTGSSRRISCITVTYL